MENFNFLAIAVAALIPLAVGFFWYGNIGFGKAWMAASGMTEEKVQSGNMPMIFGLTLVLGFVLAFTLQFSVIHQFHVFSMIADDPGVASGNMDTEAGKWFLAAMDTYGSNFRTFKHGVLHGAMTGLLLILPILTINGLFERRSFKYIALHAGYWTVTLGIMGGILSAWQ